MTNKQWHRNNAEGLRWLNAQLKSYKSANPQSDVPTKITMSQLRSSRGPKYPTLKAKAAHTRHAVAFALTLAARHMRGDRARAPFEFRASSPLHPYSAEARRLVLLCVQALNNFLVACDAEAFDMHACRAQMFTYFSAMRDLKFLCRGHAPAQQQGARPWHLRLQYCGKLSSIVSWYWQARPGQSPSSNCATRVGCGVFCFICWSHRSSAFLA